MPPTYEFECLKCEKNFETIESIKDYDGDGQCPTCGNISRERIFSSKVLFIGTKVENAEYNPAFGQVVKNSQHRKELAKQKGLIEVGTEPPEKIHKKFESDKQEQLKKSWDDV